MLCSSTSSLESTGIHWNPLDSSGFQWIPGWKLRSRCWQNKKTFHFLPHSRPPPHSQTPDLTYPRLLFAHSRATPPSPSSPAVTPTVPSSASPQINPRRASSSPLRLFHFTSLNMFAHLAIFYYLDHLRTSGFPTNRCGRLLALKNHRRHRSLEVSASPPP